MDRRSLKLLPIFPNTEAVTKRNADLSSISITVPLYTCDSFFQLLQNLTTLYNSTVGNLDVFAGMLLEADGLNPGPLVKAVVMEQFTRLRKADRFWFENPNNG
jgi:hypothetical protein